jgi:hypothetical protein
LNATGDELPITPQILGLHGDSALRRHYIIPMGSGNKSAARLLADRVNIGRKDPIIAFRVQSDTYAISSSGVILENRKSMTYPVGH